MATDQPAATPPMMFPLMLDVASIPIFLIGGSAGLQARLDALLAHGATKVHVFLRPDDTALRAPLAARVRQFWPDAAEFAAVWPKLVFISDASDEDAARWRTMAHTVGAFVHVQDRISLCDFHMPAVLRHGHLQLTVSTDGVAPGLARILRDHVADHVIGPEWAERVNEVRAARDKWRGEGLSIAKLGAAIADFMKSRGWLAPRK